MASEITELDATGEALWAAVTAAWQQQEAHDRFVGHCYATARLAAAGARYRARAAADPADPLARKMQERIVFLSMQALVPSTRAAAGRGAFFRSPWFVALVLGCAALGALLGFTLGGRR